MTATRSWLHTAGLRDLAWFVAGVDPQVAQACPLAEQARLTQRGLLLALLCVVNFVASTDAVAWLVMPDAPGLGGQLLGWGEAVLLGGIWTLVVLNLYRFLVSMVSGRERLRLGLQQLVRTAVIAVLTLLIALVTALPLMILLVSHDIRSQSTEAERALAQALREGAVREHRHTLHGLYLQQVEQLYALDALSRRKAEIDGAKPSVTADPGDPRPEARARRLGDEAARAAEDVARAQTRLAATRAEIKAVLAEVARRQQGTGSPQRLNGFWSEAQRVLEHAAPVYWGCAVVLFLLYALPLWIRAFSHRGLYEHLVDIQNEMTRLRHGIVTSAWQVRDHRGETLEFSTFAAPEALARATVARLEAARVTAPKR